MKFLVLCVVAFYAPQLLDEGSPPAQRPFFDRTDPLPAEEAPYAGPAEPGDPDHGRIFKRRSPRGDRQPGRIRQWLQERREARLERRKQRTARQARGRRATRDVDQARFTWQCGSTNT